jgi:hypothetical protein
VSNLTASNQTSYRLIIYITKTQPLASIKLASSFKLNLQPNNYVSFYDEANQAWSVMFEQEPILVQFLTQTTLAKFNVLQESATKSDKILIQDLKMSSGNDEGSHLLVEADDSVEISTLLTVWKDYKFDDVRVILYMLVMSIFLNMSSNNKLLPIILYPIPTL